MKLERSDVQFPMWRKKVDASLLNGLTPIPVWCCEMWDIQKAFPSCYSKTDPDSEVSVRFDGIKYSGNVTVSKESRPKSFNRLFFEDKLADQLKNIYQMSFLRAMEDKLPDQDDSTPETTLLFWEFLDIEYDSENKIFIFVAHYIQESLFPKVFEKFHMKH